MAFHTCEVHRLVDRDSAPRICRWCDYCKSWICGDCWYSPKRIAAFVLKLKERVA